MPLPEDSDKPTATQLIPAVVKLGQRFEVPMQSLKKKKNKPGNKLINVLISILYHLISYHL